MKERERGRETHTYMSQLWSCVWDVGEREDLKEVLKHL